MKFRRRNDLEVSGIRLGFNQRDTIFINRETHTPKTQIFSTEELEEEPEQQHYYCAMCKSPLEYLKHSETIWRCNECLSYYDTKIQDSPIKDKEPFKLTPYSDLMHYPTSDQDGPFFEVINLDNRGEGLENRSFEDKRIQHINLHNVTFADAIRFGALSSKKNKNDIY